MVNVKSAIQVTGKLVLLQKPWPFEVSRKGGLVGARHLTILQSAIPEF